MELSRAEPNFATDSIHLCAGHEAIPVDARSALRPVQLVVATNRGHGWALEPKITARDLMLDRTPLKARRNKKTKEIAVTTVMLSRAPPRTPASFVNRTTVRPSIDNSIST